MKIKDFEFQRIKLKVKKKRDVVEVAVWLKQQHFESLKLMIYYQILMVESEWLIPFTFSAIYLYIWVTNEVNVSSGSPYSSKWKCIPISKVWKPSNTNNSIFEFDFFSTVIFV